MTLPCLILAGGLGTRMRPVTDTLPKALVPVDGRPFIDIQLEQLASQGVRDIVLSIGYRGDLLRAHVGNGTQFGARVRYVDEGDRRLGTGGAVRLAIDRGAVADGFFVLYGDSYLDLRFPDVADAWRQSGKPALMTVLRNANRWGVSNAQYRAGLVVRYDKHRPTSSMRWIDYGLLVLTDAAVSERVGPDTVIDLADVLHSLSVERRLAGYVARRRFHEVGSPTGVRELERHLRRRRGSAG